MINLFKKISKGILITIGTLVSLATMGIGSVGIYYKQTSIDFYNGLRNGIINTTEQVKEGLNSAKNLVHEIFTEGQESLKTSNSDLNSLENQVNNIQNDSDAKKQIQELIQNIKTAIKIIEDQIGATKSDGSTNNNQSEIEGSINKFIDTTTDVDNKIQEVAGNMSSTQFSEIYETVTVSMTVVPAVILSVIIVTSIIQLILYKKIDGVRVRRSKAKSDLVKHMNKILKKYPDLKNDIE